MAPQKLAAEGLSKAVIKPVTASNGRVTKPKRPYIKFRNGKLNLKPKGEYKCLVKENSLQSPLLRLPPEIQHSIWTYALSGHIIKPHLYSSAASRSRNLHRFSVLRVCRQIYDETAALPFSLGIIWFHKHPLSTRSEMDRLPSFQREALRTVRLNFTFAGAHCNWVMRGDRVPFPILRFLNLKRIELITVDISRYSDSIRRTLRRAMDNVEADAKKGNDRLEVAFLKYLRNSTGRDFDLPGYIQVPSPSLQPAFSAACGKPLDQTDGQENFDF